MKQLIVLVLLISLVIDSRANTYGIMTGNIDKVYYTGIVAGETQYQNQAIAYLCNEFMKSNYPQNKEKVFLELGFSDNPSFKLSYDKFQGTMWDNAEKNRPAKGLGIRIRLSQRLDRAESVLKLLDYGLQNLSELKKSSKDFYSLSYYDQPDELTVDSLILSNVLRNPTNVRVTNILNLKVPRNLGNIGPDLYKEYYFQNDKYFFIDYFNKDSIYLQLDRVYQIINEYYLGSLIFETDSTGYFYNRETKQLSQKFTIQNKKPSFYFIHTSSDNDKKRIYFEYNDYGKGNIKFIYLTDKLFLIQRVEEFEDELIRNEFKKSTKG
jgi:hypothetical protein